MKQKVLDDLEETVRFLEVVEVGEYQYIIWFESSSRVCQVHNADSHLCSAPYIVEAILDNSPGQKRKQRQRKIKLSSSVDGLLLNDSPTLKDLAYAAIRQI
ncbi:hypothetical protein BDEG_22646 [Batrachochytrium dendrobatidis JEL423]|uniref:Uncharacterized protein n=1 Tax=Batrachochytrium dendrobatidis (strain JEL423) TaxID=403673 RepID=A0A177WHB6_BATDL|nr:hypothetical protein BDEG_22646 [Batrachochytrium dendrobatidis JEL423]